MQLVGLVEFSTQYDPDGHGCLLLGVVQYHAGGHACGVLTLAGQYWLGLQVVGVVRFSLQYDPAGHGCLPLGEEQ